MCVYVVGFPAYDLCKIAPYHSQQEDLFMLMGIMRFSRLRCWDEKSIRTSYF